MTRAALLGPTSAVSVAGNALAAAEMCSPHRLVAVSSTPCPSMSARSSGLLGKTTPLSGWSSTTNIETSPH